MRKRIEELHKRTERLRTIPRETDRQRIAEQCELTAHVLIDLLGLEGAQRIKQYLGAKSNRDGHDWTAIYPESWPDAERCRGYWDVFVHVTAEELPGTDRQRIEKELRRQLGFLIPSGTVGASV